MYTATYATPPGYVQYEYIRSPPVSPSPGTHGYYSPRFSAHTATPSPQASPKVHARRASHDPPIYSYSSPRAGHYYGGYTSPHYYQTAPQWTADYVSPPDAFQSKSKSFGAKGAKPSQSRRKGDNHKRRSSHKRYVYTFGHNDDEYVYEDAPPPYQQFEYDAYGGADHFGYYGQVPIYTEAEPTTHRSRARRASHSNRPQRQQQHATPKRPSTAKASRKATEDDARRAGVPAGFSYKNWDPSEEPILLLGSVFDANSLGKWIYDWTVFHYGAGEPMTDVAGELWLLLIQLSGKVKRAEECKSKIRKQESLETVEDFLDSGDRLWARFGKLLKICEEYMMKAAKRECGEKKPVTMGKNSGCEFVDSIFGRDRELEKTEKLMTGVRLWSMRFDANCEDILRNPSA